MVACMRTEPPVEIYAPPNSVLPDELPRNKDCLLAWPVNLFVRFAPVFWPSLLKPFSLLNQRHREVERSLIERTPSLNEAGSLNLKKPF